MLECDCTFLTGYLSQARCARRSASEGKSFLGFSTRITWPCSVCWNSALPVFIPFAVPSLPVPLCHGHGESHTSTSLCPCVGSEAVGTAGTRKEAAGCSQGYVSPFFELSKAKAVAPQITNSGCSCSALSTARAWSFRVAFLLSMRCPEAGAGQCLCNPQLWEGCPGNKRPPHHHQCLCFR